MYRGLPGQKIPSGIVAIRPEELERVWLKKIDLSGYRRYLTTSETCMAVIPFCRSI